MGKEAQEGDTMFELPEGRRVSNRAKLRVAAVPLGDLVGNAIWVNESLVAEDILTTWEVIVVDVETSKTRQEKITRDVPVSEEKLVNLDEQGLIRVGSRVKLGDILVGKVSAEKELSTEERLLQAIFDEKLNLNTSFYSCFRDEAVVLAVKPLALPQKGVRLTLGFPRPLRQGDLLEDSVKNQYVVGKIEAIVLPKITEYRGSRQVDLLVSPEAPLIRELKDKIVLRRKEQEIPIGRIEFRKLTRCQEEKWQARSIGPYSLVTEMPLGTGWFPGQKLIRQENALFVGADVKPALQTNLREFLTIKSDSVEGRVRAYEAIVEGRPIEAVGMSEIRARIGCLLRGLCLLPVFVNHDGEEIDFLQEEVPSAIGLRIRLASAEDITGWSSGLVRTPESFNYRTRSPISDGIFCQKIFGPINDWQCACSKYQGVKYHGVICEKCGVKVTESAVRRRRMGHIALAWPMIHPWLIPVIAKKLDLDEELVKQIILFDAGVVVEPGGIFPKGEIINHNFFSKARDYLTGSEGIKWLLKEQAITDEGLLLTHLPIIPPGLRPIIEIKEGRFAASDLNDLYKRVISRSNRLARLLDLRAFRPILENEARMLQEGIWTLFDNLSAPQPMHSAERQPLRSLFQELRLALSRLFERRMDYSGRGVVIPDCSLKMRHIGLPSFFIIELFKPFLICELQNREDVNTIKTAKKMIEQGQAPVLKALTQVIKKRLVLVSHPKESVIAALRPVVTDKEEAISLHPRTAAALGISFKGEQVNVHLPLSDKAQQEAKDFLYPPEHRILEEAIPVIKQKEDFISITDGITSGRLVSLAVSQQVQILSDLDKLALGV